MKRATKKKPARRRVASVDRGSVLTLQKLGAAINEFAGEPKPQSKPQWSFNAPLGIYTNPELTDQLTAAAAKHEVVRPMVREIIGFGKQRGETITLQSVTEIPFTPEPLSECAPIEDGTFKIVDANLQLQEFGTAFPYRSLSEDLGEFDSTSPVQAVLIDRIRLLREAIPMRAFKSTRAKVVLNNPEPLWRCITPALRWITDGKLTETAWTGWRSRVARRLGIPNEKGIRAGRKLIARDVQAIAQRMVDLGVPTIDGAYFAFVGCGTAFHLKAEPEFFRAWHYAESGAQRPGEIGRMQFYRDGHDLPPVHFIQVGTSLLTDDEAVFFGAEAVAVVEAQPLELRAAIPTDFGRYKAVAVYGISAAGLLFDSVAPGECRVIHVANGPELPGFKAAVKANLRNRWDGFKGRTKDRTRRVVRQPLAALLYRLADAVNGERITTEEDFE